MPINKRIGSAQEALADVRDGSTVMISGFGGAGFPNILIRALRDRAPKDMTLIVNSATHRLSFTHELIDAGLVRKVVCSAARGREKGLSPFEQLWKDGKIELVCLPQGTLAEAIRAGGAGIPAFYTPVGVGTDLTKGKEVRVFGGREHVLEAGADGRSGDHSRRHRGSFRQPDVSLCASQFRPRHGDGGKAFRRRSRVDQRRADTARSSATAGRLCRPRCRRVGDQAMKLNRSQMVWRAAQDIGDGWLVNLGIGLPVAVADHIPKGLDVFFHSENGVVGVGPVAGANQADSDLVDAGSRQITLRPGASIVDSAWSFSMIRGGHIDVTILGAFEVAANGDLANWDMKIPHKGPLVGGAMDLAAAAKSVWIVMEHNTRSGGPRIVKECTLPLTAQRCVKRIYTDLAVMEIGPSGVIVHEIVEGISRDELQKRSGAPLTFAPGCKVLTTPPLADVEAQ